MISQVSSSVPFTGDDDYIDSVGGEKVAKAARFFIDSIPLLQQLEKEGYIQAEHRYNAMYAHRSPEDQAYLLEAREAHYPVKAICFAIKPSSNNGIVDYPKAGTFTQRAYHGSIEQKNIPEIVKGGLKDRSFVTPSWVLACECYGYHHKADDGSLFALFFKVQVNGDPVDKYPNTWVGNYQVDAQTGKTVAKEKGRRAIDHCIEDDAIEWVCRAEQIIVTGLVAKHYKTARSIERLHLFEEHSHRTHAHNTKPCC